MKPEIISKELVTRELFGQQTDFLIEQIRDGDIVTQRITTVFPDVEWDGKVVRSFPPPRYPWTGL